MDRWALSDSEIGGSEEMRKFLMTVPSGSLLGSETTWKREQPAENWPIAMFHLV